MSTTVEIPESEHQLFQEWNRTQRIDAAIRALDQSKAVALEDEKKRHDRAVEAECKKHADNMAKIEEEYASAVEIAKLMRHVPAKIAPCSKLPTASPDQIVSHIVNCLKDAMESYNISHVYRGLCIPVKVVMPFARLEEVTPLRIKETLTNSIRETFGYDLEMFKNERMFGMIDPKEIRNCLRSCAIDPQKQWEYYVTYEYFKDLCDSGLFHGAVPTRRPNCKCDICMLDYFTLSFVVFPTKKSIVALQTLI